MIFQDCLMQNFQSYQIYIKPHIPIQGGGKYDHCINEDLISISDLFVENVII